MKLLVIRPQPGADATASRADAAGFDAIIMPLFAIEPVTWDVPSITDYDALMLTSGNAVRQAGGGLQLLKDLPVYVVGTATARAAQRAGLAVEVVGEAGVSAIVSTISAAGHKRLLWLAGVDRTDTAMPADMTVDIFLVYRSAILAEPADFSHIVDSCDAIMLHSPRAALYFSKLCERHGIDRAEVRIAALSAAIAASAGHGWREVITAPHPNDAPLLSELQSRFTTVSRDPYLKPE
jgi:uroporphyrinogen-III synthase